MAQQQVLAREPRQVGGEQALEENAVLVLLPRELVDGGKQAFLDFPAAVEKLAGVAGVEVLRHFLAPQHRDAARQAAVGLATFGIYKGAAPLIFRREVYR